MSSNAFEISCVFNKDAYTPFEKATAHLKILAYADVEIYGVKYFVHRHQHFDLEYALAGMVKHGKVMMDARENVITLVNEFIAKVITLKKGESFELELPFDVPGLPFQSKRVNSTVYFKIEMHYKPFFYTRPKNKEVFIWKKIWI